MSHPSSPAGTADRSLGKLVASATAEMSALVHDEIALAKAELRQDVKRGVMGGAAISIAAVFALFALPVLSFAAAYGIHNLGLGFAWSFLIVGGAFLLIAVLLALIALGKFKKVKPPEKTITSAKETAAVLQGVKPHPRPSLDKAIDKAIADRNPNGNANVTPAVTDKAAAVARSSA